MLQPIIWTGASLKLLDQSRLPGEEVYLELFSYQDVADAIRGMKVRGAPAIGIAAAYGMALAARENSLERLEDAYKTLSSTRPTAVNLFFALNRMMGEAKRNPSQIAETVEEEACRLKAEEEEGERRLSELGAELIKDGSSILTYCNAGVLAAAGYGTALGVIKAAWEKGKRIHVWVSETRPLLQGARLTCWELKKEGIPFTLITDNMAGYLMSRGKVDCVIVGADRIAANGDVANKIGTYTLAVLAKEHNIPFYVAAPTSTIDLNCPSGEAIPIEERDPNEITSIRGMTISPEGVKATNPAFDITPHSYITAIITEKGIIREPYVEMLKKIK